MAPPRKNSRKKKKAGSEEDDLPPNPPTTPEEHPPGKEGALLPSQIDLVARKLEDISKSAERKAKAAKRKQKSAWEDPKLLAIESAIVYQSTSKIESLLTSYVDNHEGTESSILYGLSAKRKKHAATVFQNDGENRFNDPEFISEAMDANERRRQGDFRAMEDAKFAEWLDGDDEKEEYDDLDRMDQS